MKTLIIIPCYNHGKHLPSVISDVRRYCSDVLVVDDGSTDNSTQVINKINHIEVIEHTINRGKGAALKTGFRYALDNNYAAVITLDADGQHSARHIPDFINTGLDHDLVIGSRMHNVACMPLIRQFSNKASSYIISLRAGQPIYDSQSGYRLIKKDLLKNIFLADNGYQMETEMIIKAARSGFKIGHVNIDSIYADEKSHIDPLRITYDFFKTLTKRD